MFEFIYSQLIQFNVTYCRVNRHSTHIFDLVLEAEGCEGFVFGKIRLNKHQEIQIDVYSKDVFGVINDDRTLGIFKEKLTKILLAQITVEQLTELIK